MRTSSWQPLDLADYMVINGKMYIQKCAVDSAFNWLYEEILKDNETITIRDVMKLLMIARGDGDLIGPEDTKFYQGNIRVEGHNPLS